MNPGHAALLAVCAMLAGCGAESGGPPSDTTDAPVPLPALGARLAIAPIEPVVAAVAEDRTYLLYELRVTGFYARALRIDSVAVQAGDSLAPALTRYGPSELERMVESFAAGDALVVEPGTESVLFFHLSVPREPEVRSLSHTFWLTSGPGGTATPLRLHTTPIPVEVDSGELLDPPLRGGPWYAHAGPGSGTHHRRTLAPRDGTLTMDQRFATDWLRLALDPETGTANGPDWAGTAGEFVHAVADGTVVAVVEGLPDEPIGDLGASGLVIDWRTISGNRVVVDMGNGRYSWYEHLESGSIRVREGERVSRGQVLGRVGNSGNTSHPHLHFAVTDSPVVGKGSGLPYRFRCYGRYSRVEPMPSWDDVAEGDPADIGLAGAALLGSGRPEFRAGEIPLGGAVVDFSPAALAGCGDA